jgi:hypothetical protein
MPIYNLTINNYRRALGRNSDEHNIIRDELKNIINSTLISLDISTLDVYHLNGDKHNHKAGNENRLIIFIDATHEGCNDTLKLENPEPINGINNNYTEFLTPAGDGVLIASEKGIPIAEYRKGVNELNIFMNMFKSLDDANNFDFNIFRFIMTEFEKLVWYPKSFENSWKHTQDKQALTKRFQTSMMETKKKLIENDKYDIENLESTIQSIRQKLKNTIDTIERKRRFVVVESEKLDSISDGLIKDLDLIITNPKVKDLQIKDNKFIIYTNPLYIHAKKKTYYGGNYRIEIIPDNVSIKFFGDNPRQSYWSSNDPHPHVNGRNGDACLGNVNSTIAELCSQMQIYALVLTAIDFLESANTDDPAGRNVVNWDEVDKDGKVIKSGGNNNQIECDYCGEMFDEQDLNDVYNEFVNEDDSNCFADDGVRVCQHCLEEHYHWNDAVDAYILDGEDD